MFVEISNAINFCQASYLMLFLHALWIPYSYKRAAELNTKSQAFKILTEANFSKLIFCNLLCAVGGSSVSAILLGKPVSFLENSATLPAYIFGFLAIHNIPYVYTSLAMTSPISEYVLSCVVDPLFRVATLISTLNYYQRNLSDFSPLSYYPQLFLGILSTTGGGTLYKWLFEDSFSALSVHARTMFFASLYYLIALDGSTRALIYSLHPDVCDYLMESLGMTGHVLTDSKVLISIFAIVGFSLRFKPFAVAQEIEKDGSEDEAEIAKTNSKRKTPARKAKAQ